VYEVPNSALATPLRPALPVLRSRVMSSLPPPRTNRLPFAKSAPATSARTNAGISPGSAEPSASNMTMASPVAAANPQAIALPLPLRV
jgi:hypothetical protein